MFLEQMKERVRGKKRRVLYVEGSDERVLQAALTLKDEDLARPVLMGSPDDLKEAAAKLDLELDGIDIHDPTIDKNREQYVEEYYKLRKHKGITKDQAAEKMKLPHYYGAMMVHHGEADGMVSGLDSKTKPFIPAFEIVKLKEGYKRASSMFVLEWPERLLFFADCSVNINPDAQGLAEIAYAAVQTVKWLEVEPRVAFLSFSTRDSAKGAAVDKVKQALAIAKKEMPETIIDGEIQFDAALLPDVTRKKAPDSPFVEAGANVFIFPDLNSGNIAYKISERLGKARATGPILLGLNKPINDVSRGCTAEGLVNAGVFSAALAHQSD
ncbi:MAG: phosphate acetyltransferase [Cyanobacteria bacterium REEB67]|nr:phosphate acetyltransferase [Cyanobacteria bacterium REEB67]